MSTKTMPKSVTAMRIVTYSTEQIINDLAEAYEKPTNEVTLDEVMEWIADNAAEDLSLSWNSIIYNDDNGNEIEYA